MRLTVTVAKVVELHCQKSKSQGLIKLNVSDLVHQEQKQTRHINNTKTKQS